MNSPVINDSRSLDNKDLELPLHQRRELVGRVAVSSVFRRSARLRELLLYIAERSLDDRLEELTEAQVGIHVFARREGFNPGDDSIVRVTARQLRAKLAEYFEGEGRDEALRLEIPKGSYVAVFSARPPVAPEPALRTEDPGRQDRWMRPLLWILVLTTLVSASAAVWMWLSPAAPQPADTLARFLLTSGPHRTLVVLSDTGLVVAHKLTSEAPGVEQYASGEYLQKLDPLFGRLGIPTELARHLRVTQHTGIADAAVYGRILRTNPDLMDRVLLRHARGVSSRDFQTDNVILVGSSGTNPWTSVFSDRLNFRPGYDPKTHVTYVTNRQPRQGEPARYEGALGRDAGYAQVSLVRNPSGSGRLLLLSGTTMEAKEAAGEFVTDAAALQRLLKLLNRTSLTGITELEVLLHATKLAGAAQESQVVAHRYKP